MFADFDKYDKNYKDIPYHSFEIGESLGTLSLKLNGIVYKVVRDTTIGGAEVQTWLIE